MNFFIRCVHFKLYSRLYGLSNKVFMNKLYKTAKMSHNARFALWDIFARLEDYMEEKKKEEMFIENAG